MTWNESEPAEQRYAGWSTEELVRATTIEREDYRSDAVELMLKELGSRKVSEEEWARVRASVTGEKIEGDESEPHLDEVRRLKNGANWFYWLAGLSLANSVMVFAGSEWGFIFGLGITQVVDGIAAAIIEEAPELHGTVSFLGFCINSLIAGFFVLLGWFARKRYRWAFILGLCLYTLDGLLFLLAGVLLGLAFHAWVFYSLLNGLIACRRLDEYEQSSGPPLGPH